MTWLPSTRWIKYFHPITMTRIGEEYLAEAMTEKGEGLLSGAAGMKEAGAADLKLREEAWEKNRQLLRLHELRAPLKELPGLLEKSYDHPVWEEKAQKCFSCGSCNLVCPTCKNGRRAASGGPTKSPL